MTALIAVLLAVSPAAGKKDLDAFCAAITTVKNDLAANDDDDPRVTVANLNKVLAAFHRAPRNAEVDQFLSHRLIQHATEGWPKLLADVAREFGVAEPWTCPELGQIYAPRWAGALGTGGYDLWQLCKFDLAYERTPWLSAEGRALAARLEAAPNDALRRLWVDVAANKAGISDDPMRSMFGWCPRLQPVWPEPDLNMLPQQYGTMAVEQQLQFLDLLDALGPARPGEAMTIAALREIPCGGGGSKNARVAAQAAACFQAKFPGALPAAPAGKKPPPAR